MVKTAAIHIFSPRFASSSTKKRKEKRMTSSGAVTPFRTMAQSLVLRASTSLAFYVNVNKNVGQWSVYMWPALLLSRTRGGSFTKRWIFGARGHAGEIIDGYEIRNT